MDITKLTKKNKCIFALKLAERASLYFSKDAYRNLIDNALNICWEWVHIEKNVGEILYIFLDNEEDGFTLLQEMEEEEKNICAWDCIIDAIAFISRTAYEEEGIQYLPEPIEMIDDSILKHMIQSLLLCDSNEKGYIEDVYSKLLKKET